MPGEFESDRWYYTTSTLHFATQELSGQQVPAMSMIRYQRPDPENPNKYIEGATLQLAIDVDPLDESAKRSLLRKVQASANKWQSTYYKSFLDKLKEAASTASPKQEQWEALYQDYPSAYRNFPKSRVTPNLDDMVNQALNNGLDSWVVEGLEESIRLLRMSKPASISALPMATAQVVIYDNLGYATQSSGPTRGAAPEYTIDELTFSVDLERNTADTAEALLSSRTGIFMILRREYEILSAPLPNKIVIDYDRALQEYRRNANFLAEAVLFATYQLPETAEKNKKSISQQFERGILKAFGADDSPIPLASLETETLQALVGRINRAVLQASWAPKRLNLRTLSSTGSSSALKEEDLNFPEVRSKTGTTAQSTRESKPAVDIVEPAPDAPARSGTEILMPGFRYRERKSSISQGFLSLAGYKKSIHDQLILDEKTPEWQNAFFLLPGIGDDPELGVREVNTNVALEIGGTKWHEQKAQWIINKG